MIYNFMILTMMTCILLFFLYTFYMTVRNDLREEKERKAKLKEGK